MKRVLLSTAIATSLLMASASVYAGAMCYSNNARNMGPWGWKSCNPDYGVAQSVASQGAMNACTSSPNTFNPATCRIVSCTPIPCGAPPPPVGPSFNCTAVGAYGHQWAGNGPNISAALSSAIANCQQSGGVNCQAAASSCVAQ